MGGQGDRAPWKVLIVEDEPDIRASMVDVLRLEGAEVQQADSIAAALPLLRATPFDLLIADQRLGDGQGLDLLAWAESEAPHAARALVSAHRDFDMLARAINVARVHLFAAKPFDGERFRRDVRALLTEHRAVEERLRALARARLDGPAAPPAQERGAEGWPPS